MSNGDLVRLLENSSDDLVVETGKPFTITPMANAFNNLTALPN